MYKTDIQPQLLSFLDEAEGSLRHTRAGLWARWGPEMGVPAPAKPLRLLFLDTRYGRGPPSKGPILSDEQWQWLELEVGAPLPRESIFAHLGSMQLMEPFDGLTIVASSIQVLTPDKPLVEVIPPSCPASAHM